MPSLFISLYGNPSFAVEENFQYSYNGQLRIAHFQQPLNIQGQPVKSFFFQRIRYLIDTCTFEVEINGLYSFHLPENLESLSLAITKPTFASQPGVLNWLQEESHHLCALFYFSSNAEIIYIGHFSAAPREFSKRVIEKLEANRIPTAIVDFAWKCQNSNESTEHGFISIQELKQSDVHFQENAVIALLVRTFPGYSVTYGTGSTNTEGLPFWPKLIANEVIRQNPVGPSVRDSCLRRLLGVAINSGVDTDYLARVNIPFGSSGVILKPQNFTRIKLNLYDPNSAPASKFRSIRADYKIHIKPSVNEFTLSSLIWNPLIAMCLRPFKGHGMKISVDWNTMSLLPRHGDRRIDLVASIVLPATDFNGIHVNACTIPVLMVETGRNPFCIGAEHKDVTKLCGAMAAVCCKFGHELQKRGIKPEKARTFGLLIGGSKAQMFAAHPEAVPLPEEGLYELQANVSSSPHWAVDLLRDTSNDNDGCTICCQSVEGQAFAQVIDVADADRLVASGRFDPGSSDFNFSNAAQSQGQHDAISEPNRGVKVKVNSLVRFNTLMKGAMSMIPFLFQRDLAHPEPDNRRFLPPKSSGLILKGRKSSNPITPVLGMATIAPIQAQYDPVLIPDANARLKRQLSLHWPLLFQRLSGPPIIMEGYDEHEITVERLFSSPVDTIIVEPNGFSPVSVMRASWFLADVLASMLILHQNQYCFAGKLQIHHVGYSLIDGRWKPAIFYAKPLTAGLAEADVLRLGEMFFAELYPALHNDVFMYEYTRFEASAEVLEATKQAFYKLEQLMTAMREGDASKRISVLDALRSVSLSSSTEICPIVVSTSEEKIQNAQVEVATEQIDSSSMMQV